MSLTHMSLSKSLRKLVAVCSRKTIRRVRRPYGSTKTNYDLYLEFLEDRMAPANVLLWTGADANINLTPGLMGNYYNNIITAQGTNNGFHPSFLPANLSNSNWIGNATPVTPTGFTNPNVPLVGGINFPSVGTNGSKSFTSADGVTTVVTRVTNVEARWFGYVNIANNGKPGNPVSFRMRSDNVGVLYIDGALVV